MEAIIVQSLTIPSRQTERQREKERGKGIERERDADRKEQWDRQIKDKSLP